MSEYEALNNELLLNQKMVPESRRGIVHLIM